MRVHSNLVLDFASKEDASIFIEAFKPEMDTIPMKRSTWNLTLSPHNPSQIIFEIDSEDITAYRATINGILVFAHVVEKMQKLVKYSHS